MNTYQKYLGLAVAIQEPETILVSVKYEAEQLLSQDQLKWSQLIQEMPVKQARQRDGSLYARLYRNHKDWLLSINESALTPLTSTTKPRVNWEKRDRQFVKQLIAIRNSLLDDLDSPQQTKKFFIKKLGSVSTIEKNWNALPLTKAFLNRYSEAVSCYQIRRLTKTFIRQKMRQRFSSPSVFLRESGLSPARLMPETKRFFDYIMGEVNNA